MGLWLLLGIQSFSGRFLHRFLLFALLCVALVCGLTWQVSRLDRPGPIFLAPLFPRFDYFVCAPADQ
jgi:hypothetical protein